MDYAEIKKKKNCAIGTYKTYISCVYSFDLYILCVCVCVCFELVEIVCTFIFKYTKLCTCAVSR